MTMIGVVGAPGRPRVLAGALDTDVLGTDAFRTTAARARDTGGSEVSPPAEDGGVPLLVAPIYRPELASSAVSPGSTAWRREAIDGWVVGAFDVVAALDDPPGDADGVTAADGETVMASTGEHTGAMESAVVEAGTRRWVVQATSAVGGGLSTGAVVLVALVILGAAGAATVLVVEDRRRRVAEEDLRRERQRSAVVGDLTPVLQRSLQLSEVLPSLAVLLADRFGLAGLSITASDATHGSRELFRHGRRPSAGTAISARTTAPVAAGRTVSLPLSRGGRQEAELRFVTGRDLTDREMQAIHESAELVTSAIVTAQAIQRQQDAMERLSELDALRTVFLSTAAHELKTPLSAVLGMANALESHWDQLEPAERRVMAERVATNARSLDLLVRDLLDFSRLETGVADLAPHPADLAGTVREVLDRLQVAWVSHRFTMTLDEGPPVMIDALAVERVLTNLVSNAVKYSGDGSAVDVRVRHRDGYAELLVDDDGPGVPEADRELIFERFYRGTGNEVVRTRGVGIGLSVVREFVRKLGGTIDVVESPSGGARFVCRFPHVSEADEPALTGSEEWAQ